MSEPAPRPTSASPAGTTSDGRSRARFLLWATAAVIAYGLVLLIFFEPDVETLDAAELAESDDAVPFLVADLFFPVLYGIVLPLTMVLFSRARWVMVAAALLLLAGVLDWAENVLLLTATDTPSESTVDAGRVASWVNLVLFAAGALPGLVLVARAIRTVFRGSEA
ncbi:MAG TPA: hypothetical protein VHG69_00045 [Thermoleophilaceae bacterium]|nr:hypothetical protein [Thermoleophilaceae bacterium]